MVSVKLDQRLLGYLISFENVTRAHVRDLFVRDGLVVFVVEQGDGGKAIGRRGSMIKKLVRLFRKKIKVIELSSDVTQFIINVIEPVHADQIEVEGKVVVLSVRDIMVKGKLIGRNGRNIALLKELVEKYFGCTVMVK